MLTFWRCQVFICQQHEVCVVFSKESVCMRVCLYTCFCACENVRMRVWGTVCADTYVLGSVCFLRCVFRKGAVRHDDWRHPCYTHTHTCTHKNTHVSWQVKAVCYLENREVIQTNCTCFWNGLTSNYTGRATHTQIAKFNSRQIIGK